MAIQKIKIRNFKCFKGLFEIELAKNGKQYEYWEARYTAGYDPGTGKQIQRSITGKTQKEVAKKLREATVAIDTGTYTAPSKNDRGAMAGYLDGRISRRCEASNRGQLQGHSQIQN